MKYIVVAMKKYLFQNNKKISEKIIEYKQLRSNNSKNLDF